MGKKLLPVLLLSVLCVWVASCGSGGGATAFSKIYKDNVVYVGTVPFEPPLLYQKGQDLVGADAQLAQRLLAKIQEGEPDGHELSLFWITRTYSTLVPALLNQEVQLVLGVFAITQERKESVVFSEPYYTSELVLIINPVHKDLRPNTLRGSTVGVREGTGVDVVVKEKFPGVQIQPFQTLDEAVLALRRSEVDAVIDDRLMAAYSLATVPGVGHMEIIPEVLGTLECAVAVRPQEKELLELINQVIQEVKSQNLYAQWTEEHLTEEVRSVEARHSERMEKARRAAEPRRVVIRVSKSANYDFDIYRMANLSFVLKNHSTGSSYNSSRIDFRNSVGIAGTTVPPGDYTLSLPRFNFNAPISISPNDPQQVTISIVLSPGSVEVRKS